MNISVNLSPSTNNVNIEEKYIIYNLISEGPPAFTNVLKNVSVPIERDVTFTCNVRNIGRYRVSGAGIRRGTPDLGRLYFTNDVPLFGRSSASVCPSSVPGYGVGSGCNHTSG